MEPTTEVRWWWRGASPDAVDRWFSGLAGVVRDEARVDHYLLSAGDADTGIKARAGERLEIKTLSGREPPATIAPDVVGVVEQWVKWSFALGPDSPDEDDLDRHGRPWLRTHKRRWLVEVEDGEIELATVEVGPERWWTLAVEVWGHDPEAREQLLGALRWLRSSDPPPALELSAEHSHGYAAHLQEVRTTD